MFSNSDNLPPNFVSSTKISVKPSENFGNWIDLVGRGAFWAGNSTPELADLICSIL